jgi:protein-S-isoprenylcysteine O-methyltransferase Ste14
MRRTATLLYGIACYAMFFAAFLYLLGFLANVVPVSIDGPASTTSTGLALLINVVLIALFGLQHSVMARPGFKEWWTRFVPQPIERSVYVLASSVALIALFVFWQPIPQAVWATEGVVSSMLTIGLLSGVALVLVSTFLIDHFDLFGLRQTWLHFRGRPYQEKRFATPLLYRYIRHPLYVGWFMTFWVTPFMSAGHLLFALVMTGYVLVAIPMEERDLLRALGEPYLRWREGTPMFVPRIGAANAQTAETAELH